METLDKKGVTIEMIACMAHMGAIGCEDRLPWSLPKEMAHFKATTTGKTILMGRKTAVAFPKALPNRINLVLTRQPDLKLPTGMIAVGSLQEAIDVCADSKLMVIGGAELYKLAMPYADTMHLTVLPDLRPTNVDTYFPVFDLSEWRTVDLRFDVDVNRFTEQETRMEFIRYERQETT